VRRDFAAASDLCAFLHFNKGADLRLVSDFAAVEIRERKNLHVFSKFDALGDLTVGRSIQVQS
jgi:hypothetical protein